MNGTAGHTSDDDLDDALFTAFNLPPEETADHRFPRDLLPDVDLSVHHMKWTPGDGRSGRVPKNGGAPYGLPVAEVPYEETGTFSIACTIAMPASRKTRSDNSDLPLIGLLHGVPMNRRLKYQIMRILGQRAIVVCWDMLGMGESDAVLNYRLNNGSSSSSSCSKKVEENEAWDWVHDVPYVHKLMTEFVPPLVGLQRNSPWIFQADDWGAGIALHYAALYPEMLRHLFLVSAILGDGHFVIEIGTIGRLAELGRLQPEKFTAAAFGLPQILVGIEKYMVEERWKMNRYTESSYLRPYQDVNYQAGRTAADMGPNYWNLRVLTDRASRLAARQLQPYSKHLNPCGVKFRKIRNVPVDFIGGKLDPMMPPAQGFRACYLFPNARVSWHVVDGANHFVELDRPDDVARIMIMAILRENKVAMPVFVGHGNDFVYKGDEREHSRNLEHSYLTPHVS